MNTETNAVPPPLPVQKKTLPSWAIIVFVVGFLLCVFVLTPSTRKADTTVNAPQILGTWRPLNSPNASQRFRFTDKGRWEQFIPSTGVISDSGAYKIDWSKSPATINFGDQKGIVRFDGDSQMDIAFVWAANENERPQRFERANNVTYWRFVKTGD